ncbi:MAG: hypothetical protein SFV52_13975 [Saprospiraceae bacterium]|nr:hypothetical protein [Saprospiraceae bacterium]
MAAPTAPSFADFVRKFPPVTPPLTLGEDAHHVFSLENEPLSAEMISRFIHPFLQNNEPDDEFTEYVPCLAVEDVEKFVALIWWRAGLLQYSYYLSTYTPAGEPIQSRVIAGTRLVGEHIHRSVATMDEDHIIWIAEGEAEAREGLAIYDATNTRMKNLELLANGMIV